MNYIQRIREQVKISGGIITYKELKKNSIPTIYLKRMMEKGELTKVDRGIYIGSNGDYDEYFFFNNKYKVPVFSFLSALYIHNFTDIIPSEKEITVYKGYNSHCVKDNTIIHYATKEIYELGITEKKTMFGNIVKVYDLEKTICDLVKNRNKIDSELFSKAINRYGRYENKDLEKLYSYSKKMKIYEEMKDILNIIYE